MKLLLIRHGVAEDQDAFARTGKSDDLRPLTSAGAEELRAVARGLKLVVKEVNVIATSPLTRARQTAEIVGASFPSALRETINAMMPDARYQALLDWLGTVQQRKCMAAVGHDPHISGLACWLLGAAPSAVEFRKGAAMLLEFDDELSAGKAKLRWYMTPKQMSLLGVNGG